jgi:tetratricopeptide (TPR) repeat protein
MLREDPDDSFLNYALALEYEKLDNIPKAISILETLLEKSSDYLGAYYKLGKLYERQMHIYDAEGIYRKGIELAEAQKNRKAAGELREALDQLEDL